VKALNCWRRKAVSKEGAQPQERIQQVAADYLALAAEERERTLVLAGTNMERLALTQAMRSGLQEKGPWAQMAL
jgi:hypothetical protein